ncbi:MAG TPA: ABC transporter substrate-binding protein [Alcaligenaceae bacterium]|nr:ABC transporter substrate-binding protein [Alcaligenaceae bacterium]
MKRRQLLGTLALSCSALLGVFANASVQAQTNWPERPIKLLVGYAAGGPVDVTARVFAKYLGEQLKQNVVVENRGGASGMIAADATAKATPDGYTLNFIASPSMTIAPVVQRSKLFDPRKDFTLIGPVVNYANILLIGPQIKANSVKELIDYAKANPDKVAFGSAGVGASNHLSAELLRQSADVQMLHVPYKGNSPAMMDVVSGKITFMFDIVGTGKVFVDNGQARGLAVTSKTRNPSMPNVPTMIEAGIADYEVIGWFALVGPKGMPDNVTEKLISGLNEVRKNPDFRKAVEEAGYTVEMADKTQLLDRINNELVLWQNVVTKGNIQNN